MEPLAVAGYTMIAATLALSLMAGAMTGLIVWRFRSALLWGGLLACLFFLFGPTLLDVNYRTVAVFGMPLFAMTFLVTFLAGRHFRNRLHWNTLWSTVAAFGCVLILGTLYVLATRPLFMESVWSPVWIAAAADVCLVLLAVLNWRREKAVGRDLSVIVPIKERRS